MSVIHRPFMLFSNLSFGFPLHFHTWVEFTFKMGWTYGRGPGCTEHLVGQLDQKPVAGNSQWHCTRGCGSVTPVANVSCYCKGANPKEGWEQGQKSFTYSLTRGQGPCTLAYAGGNWRNLDGGKEGGTWNLGTVIDLRQRSDSGQPNSSPATFSKPIYYTQFDCDHSIRIPVLNPDGDYVDCRMTTGNEYASVCDALPGVTLDEKTCTLSFRPDTPHSYRPREGCAVAISAEDFPVSPIAVGEQTFRPGDVLTSVPVQFLTQTPTSLQPCDWRPVFVNRTPAEGAQVVVKAGDTLDLSVYATNLQNPRVTRSSEPGCFTVKAWDIDPCHSTHCQQSGACTCVGGTSFTCTCMPGFKDPVRSTDIDECVTSLCQNAGTCIDQVDGYLCNCPPGYTDMHCQTDKCASGPCQNSGTCRDQVSGYLCQCAPGYTDRHYQTNIDVCASGPCQNGGTCRDQVNGYLCQCAPGYTDQHCQTDIGECANGSCQNGGTCRDQVNGYQCQCAPGYIDRHCQKDIDECASGPCQNDGTRRDQVSGYLCQCASGYTDQHCQTDECASGPCQNGGTCKEQVNGYLCQCAPGYTDLHCQIDIDKCASSPCQNRAACKDQVSSSLCQCAPGCTDTHCQTDMDECVSNLCQNGGTCIDHVNGYLCQCPPGCTGLSCGTDVDQCVSGPCQNGGTCRDQVNGYLCQCAPGYTDRHCQTGLALDVPTYFLLQRCCTAAGSPFWCSGPCGNRTTLPRSRSPISRWRASHPAKLGGLRAKEMPSGEARVGLGLRQMGRKGVSMTTNIYRVTCGDTNHHSTSVKKRPDTYASSAYTGWAT